jgi:hypothetical protein
MREAKLVGLSPDGTKVILAVADTGEEVAVGIDDRLRAAVRGDRARLGQLEITMESALRPRDIQARIRSGESPEAVAAVAQMPVERVMAFAGPVLAERDHIATIAQRAAVRRRGGEGPSRNLGTWVTERLRSKQVDPNSADWDAWRRDDGRWAVRVEYTTHDDTKRTAMFAYDAPGRFAVPDDDEARWLVGEQPPAPEPRQTYSDPRQQYQDPRRPAVEPRPAQPQRRLAAVDDDFEVAPDHGADAYEAGFEDAVPVARADEPARAIDRRPRVVPAPVDEVPELPVPTPAPVRPAQSRPAQSRPAQSRPAQSRPAPPRPVQSRPEESRPAESGPAEVPAGPRAVPAHPDEEETIALDQPAAAVQTPEPEPDADQAKKRGTRRTAKRASVPSWDEIMFGKKAD